MLSQTLREHYQVLLKAPSVMEVQSECSISESEILRVWDLDADVIARQHVTCPKPANGHSI
jgi:hypothetical protein